MAATLSFTTLEVRMAELAPAAATPDLLQDIILQNDLVFHLDEDDEIYEGYGKRKNAYPYTQQNLYTRALQTREIRAAVLENQHMKAVFLPGLGGRLWSLTDKAAGRELLYTNDVIRFGNLATRNAWFSGGVEWNVGIIGHTPLTNEPLFAARLQTDGGEPVLRLYEYERIRGVEYQMDFWLAADEPLLNCRMRIVNHTRDVLPMYWWSNMAVPEYEGGRIVVPAAKAYSYQTSGIHKVDIPMVDGVDISRYKDIPRQVDYFFDIPQEAPKYIANFAPDGYGLLHLSTRRLQSRKLFSWGNNPGSARWQEFLTDQAGRYVEIQAGLGKTQYGCLPMAPATAWEWLEQYGPAQLPPGALDAPFAALREQCTQTAGQLARRRDIESVLQETKPLAKTPAEVVWKGSGFGALDNALRRRHGQKPVSPHLNFASDDESLRVWEEYLDTGKLARPDPADPPGAFMAEAPWHALLRASVHAGERDNWFAQYHYGVLCAAKGLDEEARLHLQASLALEKSCWAHHALAAVFLRLGEAQQAVQSVQRGIALRREDASYLKDCFKMLLHAGAPEALIEQYEALPEALQNESRLRYDYIVALHNVGRTQQAYDLLNAPGYELVDIREGDTKIGELWQQMHETLYGEAAPVPHRFNFYSL